MPAARGRRWSTAAGLGETLRVCVGLDHDELDGCSDEDIFYILFGVPDGRRMIRKL
jgi:hypothetical protein